MTDTFKPGDRVEWRYSNAEWDSNPATIVARRGGSPFYVIRTDGGAQFSLNGELIRPLAHVPTQEELEDAFRNSDPRAPEIASAALKEFSFVEEGPLEAAWEDLEDESRDIFFSRHKKYGPRNIADAPGGALNGVVVRMHDKMARLRNFIEGDKTEYSDESIHDTLIDIGNYANIARLILKDQWPS